MLLLFRLSLLGSEESEGFCHRLVVTFQKKPSKVTPLFFFGGLAPLPFTVPLGNPRGLVDPAFFPSRSLPLALRGTNKRGLLPMLF
jgi:hypothetical protein